MSLSPFDVFSAQDFLFPAATTLYVSRQNKPRYSGVLCGPVPHWTVTPYSVAFFVSRTEAMVIKAIETVYKGYKFRSRLEARWALYFDELGIEFEYEIEGYEFAGERYLPDFWLPEVDTYVDVKPGNHHITVSDLNALKIVAFSDLIAKPIIVTCGDPGNMPICITFSGELAGAYHCTLARNINGQLSLILFDDNNEKFLDYTQAVWVDGWDQYNLAAIAIAWKKARQARFGKAGRG